MSRRNSAHSGFDSRVLLSVAFVFILFFCYSAMHSAGAGPAAGRFIDTDDATRAMRILALMQGQSWYDPILHLVGPGLESHWTRPSDIIVLLGAYPLHWFGLSIREAILYTSAVTPVLLLLCFFFSYWWMVKPLRKNGTIAETMLAFAPFVAVHISSWFAPMRIDHHAMISTWCLLILGMAIRFGDKTTKAGWPLVAGLVVGMACWIGIEEILFVGAFFVVSGAWWALTGDKGYATKNFLTSAVATIVLALCVLAERGVAEFSHPTLSYDKISLLHIVLFLGVTIGWGVILHAHRWINFLPRGEVGLSSVAKRFAVGGVAGSIVAIALLALQPNLFFGHLDAAVDQTYQQLRLHQISEGQPIVTVAYFQKYGLVAGLWLAAGSALVGIFGVIGILWSCGQGEFRGARLSYALFVAVFLVAQIGWKGSLTYYNSVWLEIFGIAGTGLLIAAFVEKVFSKSFPQTILGVSAAMLLLGAMLYGLLSDKSGSQSAGNTAAASVPACDIPVAVRSLLDAKVGEHDTVLALSDIGPEIMWQTGAKVLSIPNHHFQPGFAESHAFFMARSDTEAEKIASKLGVTAFVVCQAQRDDRFTGLGDADGDTFGKRILAGDMPSWARLVSGQVGPKVFMINR